MCLLSEGNRIFTLKLIYCTQGNKGKYQLHQIAIFFILFMEKFPRLSIFFIEIQDFYTPFFLSVISRPFYGLPLRLVYLSSEYI